MRFLIILFLIPVFGYTQKEKISVKKQDTAFYFFQTDKKSDTLIKGKNDLFYMYIPSNKRCNTKIEIRNAQLIKTKKENIFQLKQIPGINYIHLFNDSLTEHASLNTKKKLSDKKTGQACLKYNTLVNGANNGAANSIVTIKFIDLKTNSVFLSNKFYCQ